MRCIDNGKSQKTQGKKVAETMRFELMEGITLRTLSKGVV
jgi:hypothetical protein